MLTGVLLVAEPEGVPEKCGPLTLTRLCTLLLSALGLVQCTSTLRTGLSLIHI